MAYGSVLTDTVQSSTAATPVVFKDGNGTQIGTLCRAWVNFNGTGTVAIRASFNVSSITDNGTGDYTVNFTTALPDANYAGLVGVSDTPGLNRIGGAYTGTRTTSAFRVITSAATTAAQTDNAEVSVSIFR